MPVWLVTGGSGFLGRPLLEALVAKHGSDVFSLGRVCPRDWPTCSFVMADLEKREAVAEAIRAIQPDYVIHAAGKTPPADAETLYRANVLATIHLLDALRAERPKARVVLAGSAAELGPVSIEDLPVDENHTCKPVDPYGLSKWLATCAGLAASAPLEVIAARIFNPIGPRQPASQAFGRFAARLLDPVIGPMIVGDLEAKRDFIDVRDVTRALITLAEQGRSGEIYNVGTGHSHQIHEGLTYLLARSGRPLEIQIDPDLKKTPGPRDSRANIFKITTHTGWRPEISWDRSLDDLWNDATERQRLPLTV